MHSPVATPLSELHYRTSDIPDCYPKGRICVHGDCEQELCIWNPGPTCWAFHAEAAQIDTKPTAEALVELMEQRS